MKIYNIAIASLALMLSPIQTLASKGNSMDDITERQTPSFPTPAVESFLANENRYIVKYKPGSKEFQTRMKRAARKQARGKLRKTAFSDDASLFTAGSFMPKDNAEIVYLNSEEEVKQWNERDDVEYVEHGTLHEEKVDRVLMVALHLSFSASLILMCYFPYFLLLDVKVYLSDINIQSEEIIPYGINTVHALDVPDTYVSNRKVCIVDSGYNINHDDLPSDPEVVTGYMGDLNGVYTWKWDGSGHGTHVAGTIAAIGGNNKGVTGVIRNGQVKLHIVRVFNNDGRWAWGSTLTAAVEECVDAGANVVNMSLGGPRYSEAMNQAFERIFNDDDVILVASSGNGGQRAPTTVFYPAGYDSVMSVGATDSNDTIASFSTYNDQVNIAAPGYHVNSTLPQHVKSSGYGVFSGTSMACPHVVGVAALVWSLDPSKSAKTIRNILENTAEDKGPKGRDQFYGHGIVNAVKAMERVLDNSPTTSPTPEGFMYCNYSGCNGEIQGGEWCNMNSIHCEINCAGTWCRMQQSPPTSAPTKAPSPPTSAPTRKPSPSPSFGPSQRPTMATEEPSLSPTLQPTPCQDNPTAEFFLRINTNVEPEKPVYKTCDWLVSTRSEQQRTNICTKKVDSYGGYGPARDVCKAACDTCYLTDEPSASPSETPTVSPSLPPTKAPSKAPTGSPTKFSSPAPTRGGSCCSQDFRTCADLPEWCYESEGNCQSCQGIIIHDAPRQCKARYATCTWSVNSCCAPATCQGNEQYKQCV